MGMCLLRAHCSVPSRLRRKIRYQSAPRNIYRHIILSEMKEATAALPLVRGLMGHRGCGCTWCGGTCVPAGPILTPVTHGFSGPPCLLLLDVQPSSLLLSFIPSFLLHPSFLLLLQEVTSQPVMGFDPLPPLDSIVSYTRPERYHLHRWCPCWHNRPCSRRVPGTPSAPGQAAHGRSALTSSSMAEEEPWCSWQAELQAGLVRLFPVVVTTGHSQP